MFYKNIIILLILLLVPVRSFAGTVSGAMNADMSNAGLSSNVQSGLQNSYVTPETNSTLCSSNTNTTLYSVSYSESSNGDVGLAIDFYGNGTNSPTQALSVSGVAGICDQGVIVCPNGDWLNDGDCTPEAWVFDNGSLSLSATSVNDNSQNVTGSQPLVGVSPSTTNAGTSIGGGLSDCYCINDSCLVNGQSLSSQTVNTTPSVVNQILQQLGSGVDAAITNEAANGGGYIVGSATTNTASQTITYTGGPNSTNCSNTSGLNDTSTLTGMYNQGGADVSAQVGSTTLAGNSTNLENYTGVGNDTVTTINNEASYTYGSCSITNSVNVKTVTDVANGQFLSFSPISWSGSGAHTGASYTISYSSGNIVVSQNETISYARGPDCTPSGSITISLGNNSVSYSESGGLFNCSGTIPVTSGSMGTGTILCPDSGSCSSRFGWQITPAVNGNGIQLTSYGTGASWAPNSSYSFGLMQESYPVFIRNTDNCQNLEQGTGSDAGCTLWTEEVSSPYQSNSDVYLYNNGQPTGLASQAAQLQTYVSTPWTIDDNGTSVSVTSPASGSTNAGNTILYQYSNPLATSPTTNTSATDAQFGRDWWNIQETYQCNNNNQQQNFAALNAELTPVQNSTINNSDTNTGTLNYTDASGNNVSMTIAGSSSIPVPEYCVVSAPAQTTEISSTVTGQNATQTTQAISPNDSTIACNYDSSTSAWTCPVPTGDTLVTDCAVGTALNNSGFGPAAAMAQVVVQAAQSLVCSGN